MAEDDGDYKEIKPKEIKKKHDHKRYMEHEQHSKHKVYEAAAWTFGILTVVLAILFVVALVTRGFTGSGAATSTNIQSISEDALKAKTLTYLNGLLSGQGQNVSISAVKDEGDLYNLQINIGGRNYDSYARKDGSILFPSGIDLTKDVTPAQNAQQPAQTNVPKTAKPSVELFVMSHCPYGTQAEKGMLPAVLALGDKVDFNVRFVYYSMHGEKEVKEELTQYCIKTEQNDKYLKYLACFLNSTDGSASVSDACIAALNIDTTKLNSCKSAADTKFNITQNWNDKSTWLSGQFPLMNFDKDLNTKYGIGGSPTLVINGVQSSAGRSPASYLKAMCDSFTTPPAECNTVVSSDQPSAGFGFGTAAAATAAGCGV